MRLAGASSPRNAMPTTTKNRAFGGDTKGQYIVLCRRYGKKQEV